jgi:hypothetical protein
MPPRLLRRISLMVDLELWIKKTQRPAALLLFSLLLSTLICPAEAHAGTEIQASRAPSQSSTKKIRISKSSLLKLVRDFRDRLGKDENLYYLVNPPGGATVEERDEVEGEIVHFLSRIHKDPTLDFPANGSKNYANTSSLRPNGTRSTYTFNPLSRHRPSPRQLIRHWPPASPDCARKF